MGVENYDLVNLKFGNTEVVGKKLSMTDKITIEKFKGWNSKYSSSAATTEHELTWELEEVDIKYLPIFEKIKREQDESGYEPPSMTACNYDKSGSFVPLKIFYGIYIEELGINGTEPFSPSGIALREKVIEE